MDDVDVLFCLVQVLSPEALSCIFFGACFGQVCVHVWPKSGNGSGLSKPENDVRKPRMIACSGNTPVVLRFFVIVTISGSVPAVTPNRRENGGKTNKKTRDRFRRLRFPANGIGLSSGEKPIHFLSSTELCRKIFVPAFAQPSGFSLHSSFSVPFPPHILK